MGGHLPRDTSDNLLLGKLVERHALESVRWEIVIR